MEYLSIQIGGEYHSKTLDSTKLKEGQGKLFTNQRKLNDNHPDKTGYIKINGAVRSISAWVNQSNGYNNNNQSQTQTQNNNNNNTSQDTYTPDDINDLLG